MTHTYKYSQTTTAGDMITEDMLETTDRELAEKFIYFCMAPQQVVVQDGDDIAEKLVEELNKEQKKKETKH